MTRSQNPVIIRQQPSTQRWTKPGLHAYSARRRFGAFGERISRLSVLQICLAALGLTGIGYYAYTLLDQHVYQSFQNWAFDKGIAGRADVTFLDYLREGTALGFLLRPGQLHETPAPPRETKASGMPQSLTATPSPVHPAHGALLGRLQVARLGLSAMVREGVDDKVLRVAVGHVPATALPGQKGNFAIAAHRDTLFRALKDVRNDDLVTFESSDGSAYRYRVAATQIVKPSDISVLRSDGGGLITDGGSAQGAPRLLTMITCYPFTYVGSAPKRFIVEARLVEGEEAPGKEMPTSEQIAAAPPSYRKPDRSFYKNSVHASAFRAAKALRGKRAVNQRAGGKPSAFTVPAKPVKKKSFWRKLFGNK